MQVTSGYLREIKKSRDLIYENLKRKKNFQRNIENNHFSDQDLKYVFKQYDREFFNGQIKQRVRELYESSLSEKISVDPKISFRATKRSSGYGSTSGFEFTLEKGIYIKTFVFDISPNILRSIPTHGIGSVGCDSKIKCFMMLVEHEIIHLLMALWDFDSPQRLAENKRLFGPHGSLFECMLKSYFGHHDRRHDVSIDGIQYPPLEVEYEQLDPVNYGFVNWSNSCYMDAVLMVLLENVSPFWRNALFSPDFESFRFYSANEHLARRISDVLWNDYKNLRDEDSEEHVQCVDARELLAKQDPLMRPSGRWRMYESGSLYATLTQLFPGLLIDVPVRLVRPSLQTVDSMIYKSEGAFTMTDFLFSPENTDDIDVLFTGEDDYKIILWDEIKSPILVFTHQGGPIEVFDESPVRGEEGPKRKFGPRILERNDGDGYTLVGVVVLHGRLTEEGGGDHYTSYFMAEDREWYHYDDMDPEFVLLEDGLLREGVWEQTDDQMPTMYFYVREKIDADAQESPVRPTIELKKREKIVKKQGKIDYIRMDRPDGAILFAVDKVEPSLLKKASAFISKHSDVNITESMKETGKYLWRIPNRTLADKFQSLLDEENKGWGDEKSVLFENEDFKIYDYTEKMVAVVGDVPDELAKLGIETSKLKFNLGSGFVISKSKIKL